MFISSVSRDDHEFGPPRERQFKRDVVLENYNTAAVRTGSSENLIETRKDESLAAESNNNTSFYTKDPFILSLAVDTKPTHSKWMQHFSKNSYLLQIPLQNEFGFYGGIPLQVQRKKSTLRTWLKRFSSQRVLGQTFVLTNEGYIASLDDPSYVLDAQDTQMGTNVVIRKRDSLRGYTWTEKSQRWMVQPATIVNNLNVSNEVSQQPSTSTGMILQQQNWVTIHPLSNPEYMLAVEIPSSDQVQSGLSDCYSVKLIAKSKEERLNSNELIFSEDEQFAYLFHWNMQFQ